MNRNFLLRLLLPTFDIAIRFADAETIVQQLSRRMVANRLLRSLRSSRRGSFLPVSNHLLWEKRLSPRRAPKRSLLPLSPRSNPGSPKTTPVPSVWPSPGLLPPPRRPLQRKSTVCGLNGSPPRLINSRGTLPFKSSTPAFAGLLPFPAFYPRRFS